MRASSLAMFSGERTKSTQPAATGAARHRVVFGRFILRESYPALGFDRLQPSVPSVAVPERITPMARSRWSCASDSKKKSME